MKTDKILHLIQQKKAMRSGGALPLPKAQVGYVADSREFLKNWYDSPQYKEMLAASLSNEKNPTKAAKIIDEDRRYGLDTPVKSINNLRSKAGAFGLNDPSTGQVLVDRQFIEQNPNLASSLVSHELSHNSAMPKSDIAKIKSFTPSYNPKIHNLPGMVNDPKENYDAITDPEEVRAMLYGLRNLAQKNNIYNPFTQSAPQDSLEKLSLLFQGTEGSKSYDQLKRLRAYYTDEQILNMLNTISDNTTRPGNINMAKLGGLAKAQDAGSVDFRLGPTVAKANALAKQNPFPVTLPNTAVQYIDFPDNRVTDPVVKGKLLESTRKAPLYDVPREDLNKIIQQANEVGVDPATLVTIIVNETKGGRTDENLGHALHHTTPTVEGLDDFSLYANLAAQALKEQLRLGKLRYPKGPSYKQLQSYQGYGPLYPSTEKDYYGHENSAFFGIPVTKEKPLLTNKLFPYGKTIEQYRDSVIIPSLDKYGINYKQVGGGATVSDIWKQVTGSDWSQAKKLGLTDGSYEQNMVLRERLLNSLNNQPAERPKLNIAPKPKFPSPQVPGKQPIQKVAINPMVSDATSVKPSNSQLAYEYYSGQPFGLTNPSSIISPEMQYEMMQTAAKPDQMYQTPSGIRAGTQGILNAINQPTNNDLVNTATNFLAYPVQAGVNIANTIAGDTPIRSDADVEKLGWDIAAVVPMVKGIKNIAKSFKNINTGTPYLEKWNPEPGIEIQKRGKSSLFKDTPTKITVTDKTATSKVKGYNPLSSLSVKRAKDGSYSFDFNLKDAPESSAKLFKILQSEIRKTQSQNNVWGRNNPMNFYESGTMSLDSYRLLRNRARDPNFNMKPAGTTFLNAEASKTRFLDDLADPYISSTEDLSKLTPKQRQKAMDWYADGAPMQFSTKKKAQEAAERFNAKFYPGITNLERLAVPGKLDPNTRRWNLEIPNFEFTMKKYGGSTRKIKIIKPK